MEKNSTDYIVIQGKNALHMEFSKIPCGTFAMGQTPIEHAELILSYGQERYEKYFGGELPLHDVTLEKFWIAKFPVTVDNFRIFVQDTNWRTAAENEGYSYHRVNGKWKKVSGLNWRTPGYPQNIQHPVVHLSWYDAVAFAAWLATTSGANLCLPTEAEWEYAARGGDTGCRYAGVGNVEQIAWIENNSKGSPQPVGMKIANCFGLYDMCGNVWEWCKDYYDPTYYKTSTSYNPLGPAIGNRRVSRGGAWHNTAEYARCANHHGTDPNYHGSNFGFRLVMHS